MATLRQHYRSAGVYVRRFQGTDEHGRSEAGPFPSQANRGSRGTVLPSSDEPLGHPSARSRECREAVFRIEPTNQLCGFLAGQLRR